MQLLYVANRYEIKGRIDRWLAEGRVVLCDRYIASSIAYGEAQGLDRAWLADIQRFLPAPDLTILLDIAPDAAARRKAANRDRYERDMELLTRVRGSYQAQAADSRWVVLPGDRSRSEVSDAVRQAVASRLALP
jgi:dTMP kinase